MSLYAQCCVSLLTDQNFILYEMIVAEVSFEFYLAIIKSGDSGNSNKLVVVCILVSF